MKIMEKEYERSEVAWLYTASKTALLQRVQWLEEYIEELQLEVGWLEEYIEELQEEVDADGSGDTE
jgi:hypothetical protein